MKYAQLRDQILGQPPHSTIIHYPGGKLEIIKSHKIQADELDQLLVGLDVESCIVKSIRQDGDTRTIILIRGGAGNR